MFNLDHVAEIRAVNISKGKGDETPICVVISLAFESVGSEPVAAAFGCAQKDLDSLFNSKGECKFSGLTEIETWAKWEDAHTLKMLGFTSKVAKVDKIGVKPFGNKGFSLRCNVQIRDPNDHVIEKIAAALHASQKVKLEAEAELPLS